MAFDLSGQALPIFALLAQIAFTIFFGFFVRYDAIAMPITNTSSTGFASDEPAVEHIGKYYSMFQDIHVMMFIGFGFLMTFLKRYGFSSVGLNFLVAAFVLQWATLTGGWIRHFDYEHHKIHVNMDTLVNADFASAAVLISFGAVLGKVSPVQLLVMAAFEVVIYQVNELLVFDYLYATDVGDSMVVHEFGAYFGLAVAGVLYSSNVEPAAEERESSVYHSDLFAMIGTIFLWLFWPSFNAATAIDEGQLRAVINTYYSLTASCVVAFAISSLVTKEKFNMVHIQNSTLAGGVAIGTLADMIIQPWAPLVVGSVAGAISVLGYRFLTPCMTKRLRIHDTCGVHNLHGMPGLISGLGSILAGGIATEELYGDGLSKVFVKASEGRGVRGHAGFQAAAVGVSLGMAVFGGLLTGLIMRIPIWGQPRKEDRIMEDSVNWQMPEDYDKSQQHNGRSTIPYPYPIPAYDQMHSSQPSVSTSTYEYADDSKHAVTIM